MAERIQITEQERARAIELLGREPRTPFSIKTRCCDGSPQVLLADPVFVEDGRWKPFPTFLWLVCPELKLKVAHLEEKGLIRQFSEKLASDENLRESFTKGCSEIIQIRVRMAEEIMAEEVPESILTILSETTIAGSFDIKGVKCLHAHLAQELAFGNNPIGHEILAMIGICRHERKTQ